MGFLKRKNKDINKQTNSPEQTVIAPTPNMTSEEPEYVPTIPNQAIELGTINYVNLTRDGRHGDFDKTVQIARESDKPIFANFVEWSG